MTSSSVPSAVPSAGVPPTDPAITRLLDGLNPQQRAAVLHTGAPLLILSLIHI